MKIMIAVDGSETAWRALNEAIRLLPLDDRAEVTLVSVAEPPGLAADNLDAVFLQFTEQRRLEARHTLHAARRALESAGARATSILLEGDAATEILGCATRLGPDVLVVGSHGRGALGRLFLGSVSDAVARRWPGASLIVRSPAPPPVTRPRDVRSVMTSGPVTVHATDRVEMVAALMREHDTGFVPVTVEGRLVGVLTDRDLVTRVLAAGLAPSTVEAIAVCTREPVWVSPDMPVGEAVILMERHRIRRLVVVDGEAPVGVVSLGDLAETDLTAADHVLAEVSRSAKTLAHRH